MGYRSSIGIGTMRSMRMPWSKSGNLRLDLLDAPAALETAPAPPAATRTAASLPSMVPTISLYEDANNPRTEIPEADVDELAQDIRQHGILQPIVVHRADAEGRLTHVAPELNLYDDHWPILSLQPQLPPAKFVIDEDTRRGTALDSLVSSGCIVSGAVIRRSILFAKVRVGDGSLVEDSVVLPNVVIGRRVMLKRAFVDKRCVLPDGFTAGLSAEEDRARFHLTERGIVLITPEMLEQDVPGGASP